MKKLFSLLLTIFCTTFAANAQWYMSKIAADPMHGIEENTRIRYVNGDMSYITFTVGYEVYLQIENNYFKSVLKTIPYMHWTGASYDKIYDLVEVRVGYYDENDNLVKVEEKDFAPTNDYTVLCWTRGRKKNPIIEWLRTPGHAIRFVAPLALDNTEFDLIVANRQ